MARYLITGGTGFVGKALALAIRAAGDEAIVASRGKHLLGDDSEWVEYDLRDHATIANIIQSKPDGIFHLAWSTTPGSAEIDPPSDVGINLVGTILLFEEISKNLKIPVVFSSSGGTVYGLAEGKPIPEDHKLDPISIYGLTKVAAETYAAAFRRTKGLDVRIARLSNPYGEAQSQAKLQGAATIFTRKILRGEKITIWGNGNVIRDYINVEDAATGLISIMNIGSKSAKSTVIYNIGSGYGVSLNDMINIIEKKSKKTANVIYEKARPFDIPYNVLDISKAKKDLNWKPLYDINAGIARLVKNSNFI